MPVIKLELDSTKAVSGLKQYDAATAKSATATDKFLTKSRGIISTMGQISAVVTGVATGAFAMFAKKALMAAGEMEEVQGKFDTVFKGMTDQAEVWAAQLSRDFDMSDKAAKGYMSSLQDILVPTGMARDSAAQLSVEMVKLAGDLSAFGDGTITQAQAVDNLKAALTGSFEVMKKFGISMTMNEVKQKAVELGLAETTKEVGKQAIAMASYQIILDASTDAVGAHAREQDSFNGLLKKGQKIWEDFVVLLGEQFLPFATQALEVLVQWGSNQDNLNKIIIGTIEAVRFLYNGWKGLELVAHSIIMAFGKMFEFLIKGLDAVLTPLQKVFDALVYIGAIDYNPVSNALGALKQASEDFAASAVGGFKQVMSEIDNTNSTIDKMVQNVKEGKKAYEGLGLVAKKELGDTAKATDEAAKRQKTLNDIVKKTAEEIKGVTTEAKKPPPEIKKSEDAINAALKTQRQWNAEIDRAASGYKEVGNAAENAGKKIARGGGSGSKSLDFRGATQKVEAGGGYSLAEAQAYRNYQSSEFLRMIRDSNKIHPSGMDLSRNNRYGTQDKWNFVDDPIRRQLLRYESTGDRAGLSGEALRLANQGTTAEAYQQSQVTINVNQKVSNSDIIDIANGIDAARARA